MADTYFMRGSATNFVDIDILAAGPVVQTLSASFDGYWNSEHAYPIDRIVAPAGSRDDRRALYRTRTAGADVDLGDAGVPARFRRYTTAPALLAAQQPLDLTPAPAEVVADPVDKTAGTRVADRDGTVRAFVGATTRAARSEVFVVSPYFVPGQLGMDAMRDLRRRGVALRLLTNSLAATDEPVVHAGYLRYRRPMLEIGVEIHELSPELTRERNRLGRFGRSLGMLHAKIIVVDRHRLFVGSMNLDSRSERYNTEVGVLIDSAALAADLLDFMDFESSGYRVRLDPATQALQWLRGSGGDTVVLDSEPEVSVWRQLRSRLLGALLPEDWL